MLKVLEKWSGEWKDHQVAGILKPDGTVKAKSVIKLEYWKSTAWFACLLVLCVHLS